MKIEVRYQSRNGNTKAVAEIIADAFGVQALSIENPLEENADVLFLGGGVYEWKMDKDLQKFVEQLSSEKVGQIIAFSTTGIMNSTLDQIKQAAERKGIIVNKNQLLVKMMLRGHSMLKLTGGNLTEKQQERVWKFIKKIKEEL